MAPRPFILSAVHSGVDMQKYVHTVNIVIVFSQFGYKGRVWICMYLAESCISMNSVSPPHSVCDEHTFILRFMFTLQVFRLQVHLK